MTRIEKILNKVASMEKEASIAADTGGFGGGIVGSMAGTYAGAKAGKMMGANAKTRALMALIGWGAGGIYGAKTGYNTGRSISRARRQERFRDMAEDAAMNRHKALMDAAAMNAFRGSGLASPPYMPTY